MATRTGKVGSYDWSSTGSWEEGAVPTNGDTVVLPNGCVMRFDVDQSGFANGGGLLTVNAGGIFHVKASVVTYLKMNANVDVNGAFYIAERATVSSFSATSGRTAVYEAARTVQTYSVEETLGVPYLAAYNEVMEAAIVTENLRLRGLDEPEMMPDEVIAFIESTRASLTLNDYLDYVEDNPGSYYHDSANNLLYIHTSDSTTPSGKTITGIEPINRPAAGTENRCTIMFNSTGVFTNTGGGTPIIQGYGWHPERVWTQLSGDVALNATELAFTKSLDIQQGDKIIIGSSKITGTTANYLTEPTQGIYTIQSYNTETKIVTLSSGLGTARGAGDIVARVSCAINMRRTSGVGYIISDINNVILSGVQCPVRLIRGTGKLYNPIASYATNIQLTKCYCANYLASILNDSNVRGCVVGQGGILANDLINSTFADCVVIGGYVSQYANAEINRCISQNAPPHVYPYMQTVYGQCQIKDDWSGLVGGGIFKGCQIYGDHNEDPVEVTEAKFYNCKFFRDTNDNFGLLTNTYGKIYNCLFDDDTGVNVNITPKRKNNVILESFDHNQIQGQYKAWMRGGVIETLFTDEVVQPGQLIFKPTSAIYPVFRDFKITVPKNKQVAYKIGVQKDFTGGTVQAEIIDPANDPLIDTSASALKTETLPNVKDKKKYLIVKYKSTQSNELILRLSAINSSGNVYFDPIDYRPVPNLPYIPRYL